MGLLSTNGYLNQEKRETLLNTLQALLEKTVQRGCTEAEALGAAEKAQELMKKYGLSVKELKAASPTDVCYLETQVVGGSRMHEVMHVCYQIGKLTETQGFITRTSKGVIHSIFGVEADVRIASYLVQTIRSAMDFEWTKYWAENRIYENAHHRTVRKAFMRGMTDRLNARISAMVEERNVQAIASIESMESCRQLMVVKQALIEEGLKQRKIKLSRAWRTSFYNPLVKDETYFAGQAAGGRVSMDSGKLE